MVLVGFAVFMSLCMVLATWKSLGGRRLFAAVAVAWAVYAVYEILMVRRVLCTGECNIRVDLLLIYPCLIGATLMACRSAVWRRTDEAPPS